jgi:predicted oxidoreductase (fatty acid repression mutant protein)
MIIRNERKVFIMSKTFNQVVENRRSYYAIGKDIGVSFDDIKNTVEHSVKYVPSAFNSQSGRAVILVGEHHDKLWEIIRETLRKIVPSEAFASTDEKINSFKNGYGTVMFFEETEIVKGLQEAFPLYKDNFPLWSTQSSGMLQFTVWAALEELGLGASLQHYNPLIDDEVLSTWNLPKSWKLMSQMPFGNRLAEPGAKEFSPLDTRVKIFA